MMNLQQVLGVVPLGVATAPPGPAAELQGGFHLDDQDGDNLCWAAVALSVLNHRLALGLAANAVADQWEIARQQFPGCGGNCDRMGKVDQALARNGVNAPGQPVPFSFQAVHNAIRGNRPAICRVPRNTSNPNSLPHIVVIRYTDETDGTIVIEDPSNKVKVWENISAWDDLVQHLLDLYIVQ